MAEKEVIEFKVESKQLVKLIESFHQAMKEMQDRIEMLEEAQK